MTDQSVFVLIVLVLCFSVVSGRLRRGYLSPAAVFVVVGVVLGADGLGLVEVQADREGFRTVAELALTLILFTQASRLDLRTMLRQGAMARRLLGIGMPLTVVLGTVVALLLLPALPSWEAVCLAVIVAPAEAALVEALLVDPRIPRRIREGLSVESGLYDGFAVAALLTVLAIASQEAEPAPGEWAWFAFRTVHVSLAVGIVIGLVGGKAIAVARAHGWTTDSWAQLATLALAVLCFGAGEQFHGSGFATAFAGGLAYAAIKPGRGQDRAPTQVAGAASELLELVTFALFGAVVVVPAFRDADWRVLAFAIAAVTLVRLVSVLVAFTRSDVPAASVVFMGWFGPRGITTLVLGLIVLEEGVMQEPLLLTQAAVVTVVLSIVLHSVTAPIGIRLLHARDAADEPPRTVRPGQTAGDPEQST
ncbi:hypothetical protein AXA44_37845 [Rhodococcus sp. SC4]|nr:hypothetical protein AXA44_37845 [Rhodococcus sp. SC4]